MSDWRLRLYHRMPYAARVAVASLRGAQLRRWRYGEETESLVAEILARESWSDEQWRRWREERLALVLHRAATRVPFYREQWAAQRRRGNRASWELLEHWPLLSKETLRRQPEAFVAETCDRRRMFHDHTSGTTGKSLDLWLGRDAVRLWYALAEARWRRWYGVTMQDRWGILGGQLIAPVTQTRPPFWVWNAPLRQLYLSSYHLAPQFAPHYLEAIRRYELRYLLGYTSSLHALARAALARNIKLQLKVVITNAEPVFAYQCEVIERAFGCSVRETYGMAEAVAAASECEAGRLHLWPDAGVVEIGEGDDGEQAGELIATGLVNADMPLVRYRVGDRAALSTETNCACGRRLPLLAALDGRADDVLYTTDGRAVGRLDPVFKARLPVREAQVIQESLRRITVRYVPDADFTNEDARDLANRLRERMGDIDVAFDAVAEIPRGPGGKFRAVICRLPQEQIAELRQGAAVR